MRSSGSWHLEGHVIGGTVNRGGGLKEAVGGSFVHLFQTSQFQLQFIAESFYKCSICCLSTWRQS